MASDEDVHDPLANAIEKGAWHHVALCGEDHISDSAQSCYPVMVEIALPCVDDGDNFVRAEVVILGVAESHMSLPQVQKVVHSRSCGGCVVAHINAQSRKPAR
eukprot:469335-Amphidinium_carterae.1